MTEKKKMKCYKVSVFTTLFINAKDQASAEDAAHDMMIGCEVKVRDFSFDTELWNGEEQ